MTKPYEMGDPPPPDKPDWNEAPEWASCLGVATWDCDYRGEWCWIAGRMPLYFDHVERRPT